VHPARGALWIIDAHTGAKRLLLGDGEVSGGSDALQPSWSPHGKRIAFWGVSLSPDRRDILTIDPDAPQPKQTVVRVTHDETLHWNPVWSPDGTHLYFGSDADGTLNLWRVSINEQSGKTLGAPEPLSLPSSISGNFTFSQRGDLAFTTVTRSFRLLQLPFDAKSGTTGAPRTLFGGSQEILSFAPSPDGSSIAFTSGGAQEDLFIANADGSRMRQLTNDASRDRSPIWSPDGKTLYFYSNRGGANHIWSVRADGSGLAPVTNARDLARIGARNVYSPTISPDGRTLVVKTDRAPAFIHLDRPPRQQLEAIPGHPKLTRWSPDGQRIVAAQDPGILVYWPRTRKSEMVLTRAVNGPQWLPDGKSILFFENQRIGLLDLASRRDFTVPFFLPGVQLDYSSVLSRDGSSLYVRQRLEQADVWLVRLEKK
jgi:Tol biopolymer transport system component